MPRFERRRPAITARNPFTGRSQTFAATTDVYESELRGTVVETFAQKHGGSPRRSTKTFANESLAEQAHIEGIGKRSRTGYTLVGTSVALGPPTPGPTPRGSVLLLDERFAAGDPSFLDEVFACDSDKKLATLAEPWSNDTRPVMREALVAYVDDGCDRFFHKPLVKRLFKLAEARGDDVLMAHFMVAFDRLARRFPVDRYFWRTRSTRVVLISDPSIPEKGVAPTFSRATRRYLARRAFRYFRRLGRADVARYGRAMRTALGLYEDANLSTPTRLLDAWCLLHVLYAWSDAIVRDPRGIRVAPGKAIADLAPAPYWPAAFRDCFDEMLALLAEARSRTVRLWVAAWLEKEYASSLAAVQLATLCPLLTSPHEEAAAFGARYLTTASGGETLPIDVWRALLRVENVQVAPMIVAAFERHVTPRRLSLVQCVELALARIAPVADLGLRWAKERTPSSSDLATLAPLATAPVQSVREEGAKWLLGLVEQDSPRKLETLRDMLDSRFPDVRAVTIAHLTAHPLAESAIPLWLALLESPWDDVRAFVTRNATAWETEASAGELRHVAGAMLLAVHRGASAKRLVLQRAADWLAARPAEADTLLPLLALMLRSVRAPERLGALAAVTRAALADETLRGAVAKHMPDLVIGSEASA